MEYEIKKLKRIDMHTYHRLISCYGKEKINQYFDLEIEKIDKDIIKEISENIIGY